MSRNNIEDIYALSPLQQGLLFHTLYEPDSGAYFGQLSCRLHAQLDIDAFERSWSRVVNHHSILRTSFAWERLAHPVQVVHKHTVLPFTHLDWRELSSAEQATRFNTFLEEDRRRGFDLTQAPLMRLGLMSLGSDEYYFVWSHHHLLIDGWSGPVLFKEVFTAYEAEMNGRSVQLDHARPFRDYISWLGRQDMKQAKEFWRTTLSGFFAPTSLDVFSCSNGFHKIDDEEEQRLRLSQSATAALQSFARRHELTLNTLLQGAWALLLSRYTGEPEVVFGINVSGRPADLAGVESMVGLFINTLPVRVKVDAGTLPLPWLKKLQEQQVDMRQYEYSPLAEIQQWSDIPRGAALFESVIAFENFPINDSVRGSARSLKVTDVRTFEKSQYPLTLVAAPGEQLTLRIAYDEQRFEAATVAAMLNHAARLLEGMVQDSTRPLQALPMLSDAERQQLLVEWNRTSASIPPPYSLNELFEQQVARTPEAVAVVGDEQQLSYRELDTRANQLARYLRRYGVGPESLVGVFLERGIEAVVALLGIMKAGGAYVPLDPSYPAERVAWMLADAGVVVVVTNEQLMEALPAQVGQLVLVDEDAAAIAAEEESALESGVGAENLAYVIYTSGSTGRPKGVMVAHGGVCNLAAAQARLFGVNTDSHVLQFASLSFDASVWEIIMAVTSGATLHITASESQMPGLGLSDVLRKREISIVTLPPSALAITGETDFPALRSLVVAGEACSRELAEKWSEGRRFFNAYGPTETTVCATAGEWLGGTGKPHIGRPLVNMSSYIVERGEYWQPAPVGVPGELYIGGDGLARGYLNRPELTAERFLPDPFSTTTGARLYRTGDLARFLPGGNIEFLGRVDEQVKVRGYRIEPGEVEAALREHGTVAEAVVMAREDEVGEKRLVAYVVGKDGEAVASSSELRRHLQERLPEYLVPTVFVALEEIPLTVSGKIDRRRLPAPAAGGREEEYAEPRTPVEELLAGVWAEVLHVERVGVRDDFFELGGHSLLATQVISRVREVFGVELALRSVFEMPTVAAMAPAIESGLSGSKVVAPTVIERAERDEQLPLSFAQQRLWFLNQLDREHSSYNISLAFHLHGPLDVSVLEQCLTEIVRRHEVLRTAFTEVDGNPVQVISPPHDVTLPIFDLRATLEAAQEIQLNRLIVEDAQQPFDLAQEPLFRVTLLKLDDHDHVILFTTHHIISDGWSMSLLVTEVTTLYTAFSKGEPSPLPELPIQYADYAVWQRNRLQGEVLEQQIQYWRGQLGDDLPALEVPTDHLRPPVQSFRGAQSSFSLNEELTARLNSLSRAEDVTLFMVLLATFQTLLYRYTGQEQVVVGTPIANRTRRELEKLIGFFVNTLPLRANFSEELTFQQLLGEVREVTLSGYAHQEVPFEKLVEELAPVRDLSRSPIFQVMFGFQNVPTGRFELPDLSLIPIESKTDSAKFDLSLFMMERDARLFGALEYSTDLFEEATIERLLSHYQMLLAAVAADPSVPVAALPLLDQQEQHQLLVEWNNSAAAYDNDDLTVHALFERQAALTPEAPAVIGETEELSYRALDTRANQLAHYLRTLGVGPESRVALFLERAPQLVVALMGVLKAGGAYVPLDPTYPAERLGWMLEDSQTEVILTDRQLRGQLPEVGAGRVVALDAERVEINKQPETAVESGVSAENLAYVIYTSGSTGRPKGVMIQHHSLVNFVNWGREHFSTAELECVLFSTSICFDISVFELFVPLSCGGNIVVVKNALQLLEMPAAPNLTLINTVPSAMAELRRHTELPPSVTAVNLAGEAPSNAIVQNLYEQPAVARVLNLYGPTEATVYASGEVVPKGQTSEPAIGRPLANTQLYILDRLLEPAPIGVAGDLLIGGAGLARGYLNRPEQTAEKFIPDPYSDEPGARLYRTGDRARYLADGRVEFLGRVDEQVKVRGYRIELKEIEAALVGHDKVDEAVVLVVGTDAAEKRLVAYLTCGDAEPEPSTRELREHLKAKLPEYMIPSAFVKLDQFPLTPNGKVNRKILATRDSGSLSLGETTIAPRNAVEDLLLNIWLEVLSLESAGVTDNFFEAGGHSLLATRLLARVRQVFDLEVPVREFFISPTIEGIARYLESARRAEGEIPVPPLQPMPRPADFPLSFAQYRLWFLDQLEPGKAFYNMPLAVRLNGQLDVSALERCFQEIVRRHEVLRTRFVIVNGEPVQRISPGSINLTQVDLTGLAESERETEARRLFIEDAQRPFDLSTGPLLRVSLFQLSAEDHVLVAVMHHIVSDGWSMTVLVQEIMALYTAFSKDEPSPLSELPIQYADFAVWQRNWLQGEELERHLSYWRQQLGGELPVLNLPADKRRPPVQSFRGARQFFSLPAELSRDLNNLSRREGVTLFMTLLAAFQTLLVRYTGQEDLVVGADIANRTRPEVEGLLGFFVNMLTIRVSVDREQPFSLLLKRVREACLGAYAHQDVPFEKLVEELVPARDLSRSPLFQVAFVLHNTPVEVLELPGLTLRPLEGQGDVAKFDISIDMIETGGTLRGTIEYSTDLFEEATIERLLSHYQTLLAAVAADPSMPVAALPLLDQQERDQLLVEWNNSAAAYDNDDLTVHALFERQAALTSEALAVIGETEELSYRALDTRANQLAHYLRTLGVGPESRVALFLERGPQLVVALMGVLKAGGAYVPLDPTYPAERLGWMLEDSQSEVILTEGQLSGQLPEGGAARVVALDAERKVINKQPKTAVESGVSAENLAYVIYTSGSTGRPKGVMIQHRSLVNYLADERRLYQISTADRVLQFASTSFDTSAEEIFLCLTAGAALVPRSEAMLGSVSAFLRNCEERGVTVLDLPTAYWHELTAALVADSLTMPNGLRLVIIGGERALAESVDEWLKHVSREVRLVNTYGPTETTIVATTDELSVRHEQDVERGVSIGRGVAGVRTYVLDQWMQLCPIGAVGELYIGGEGVGRGYLNRPALTAEMFVPDPFTGDSKGARLYRTGDLVRWLSDGRLEYVGRGDQQVKVRGYRVEPGEVEACLRRHTLVQDAFVTSYEEPFGDNRLVAYIVMKRRLETLEGSDDHEAGSLLGEQVAKWEEIFSDLYSEFDPEQPSMFYIKGWDSSYTGAPIPDDAVREWTEHTARRILSLQPSSVLEMGCGGSGLMLLRIAPHCERYFAADLSANSLKVLRQQLQQSEVEYPNLTLDQRPADDFSGIEPQSFDAVILVSVAQYFPSADYLFRVLQRAAEVVKPNGFIFLGDIRSLPLLQAFHTSVQLHNAPPEMSTSELQQRVRKQVFEEKQLVIDPAFFTSLKQHLPRISHVEIVLERGKHHSELSKFRYDVILHIESEKCEETEIDWLDWSHVTSTDELRQRLIAGSPELLSIKGIPNARVHDDLKAVELLAAPDGPATAGELRDALNTNAGDAVDPEQIWELCEQLSYKADLTFSPANAGSFDAILRRTNGAHTPVKKVARSRNDASTLLDYANVPVRGMFSASIMPLLRDYLGQRLPRYMVPSEFVVLDELPLTVNGKIDRKALPLPGSASQTSPHLGSGPLNQTEELLWSIWAQVLGVAHLDVNDNFFNLGGHSLLATQLLSRVRQAFQVEIPLRSLFENPTLAGFAKVIETARRTGPGFSELPMCAVAESENLPLSFAQQRLWFIDRLTPGLAAYNIPTAVRLSGALDIASLDEAFSEIVRRHKTLRTRFPSVDGRPTQLVLDAEPVQLPVISLEHLPLPEREERARELALAEATAPFDLERGELLRVSLLRLAAEDHVLLLTMHHIISDGWSMGVMLQEMAVLYEAFKNERPSPLPELPIQYVDFAVWQREWLQGEVLERQLAYWRSQLGGELQVVELNPDFPRPNEQDFSGETLTLALSSELTGELRTLSRQEGATLFMILLAAFKVLLHQRSGQEDIVLGSAVANRNRGETEGLIGFFVNTLVLRTDASGNPTFRQFLRRVRKVMLDAYDHQDMPFEGLVEELRPARSLNRTPFFQVKVVHQNTPKPRFDLPSLTLSPFVVDTRTAKFDLLLYVTETSAGSECALEYNTGLFRAATARGMLADLETVLKKIVAQPDVELSSLRTLLADAARQRRALEVEERKESRHQKLKQLRRVSASNV